MRNPQLALLAAVTVAAVGRDRAEDAAAETAAKSRAAAKGPAATR